MTDLTSSLVCALAIDALEGVGHCKVVRLQARQRHCPKHSLSNEVVSETVFVRTGCGQEAAARGLFERVTELVTRELTERLEQCDIEITPDYRRCNEHSLRGFAQSLDPASDQAAHALGELEVFFGEAGLTSRGPAKHAFGFRHVQGRVLDEKRVAISRCLNAHELQG